MVNVWPRGNGDGVKKHMGTFRVMKSKMLLAWFLVSVLWCSVIAFSAWPKVSILINNSFDIETAVPVPGAIIQTEIEDTPSLVVPAQPILPGSPALEAARQYYPSFTHKTDEVFSDHLWKLVTETFAKKNRQIHSTAKDNLVKYVSIGALPPIMVLVTGLLMRSVARKHPISQLPVSTRKTIVVSIIWVMMAAAIVLIFGDSLFYDEQEELLFIALPPIIFVIGSLLWRWAGKGEPNGENL